MDYDEIVARAWVGDPEFVQLCKAMWGQEVTPAAIVAIAKDGPDPSSVHVPGNSCSCKGKCRHKIPTMDNRGIAKRRADPTTEGIATHAALGGAATVGGIMASRSTGRRLDDVGEQIGRLRSSPEGRKGLLRAVAHAKGKAKLAVTAAAVPVAGAAAGYEGKEAYRGIERRSQINHKIDHLQQRIHPVHKSADITGQLTEVNPDKHQVFGWASIVEKDGEPVVDLQGDYIGIEELEKSAYDYVQKSRIGGAMHRRVGPDGQLISKTDSPYHAADLIESFVVTPEKISKMGLPDSTPVGWWVGFKVNDPEVWSEVKSGNWTSFSIHGAGRRKPVGEVSDFDISGAEFTR